MNFIFITIAAVVQSYLFYLFRNRKTFRLQLILSISLLLFYFVVLPRLLIQFEGPTDQECGMPILAYYVLCWVFGASITIVSTFLGYLAWSRKKYPKK